jgi:hypothetical protein
MITDVSFRKGLLDRLLGCGTLVVESADDHGELAPSEISHVERAGHAVRDGENERLRAGCGD